MTPSDIRQRMKNGFSTVGSWLQLPDTSVASIMGEAGYDWVAVDLEHGMFSVSRLMDVFNALERGGTLPFARVAEATSKDIKKALDAGAMGLILPMIESAPQLETAIRQSLYPPEGCRGRGVLRCKPVRENTLIIISRQLMKSLLLPRLRTSMP